MTKTKLFAALIALVATLPALASDRVAVYAKVDRVVLEPSEQAPDTIQIWGTFSIAQPNNFNDYKPAARGYLYYRLPEKADLARREWGDLKAVAGTGQIVAFGSRFEGTPRLRPANEAPGKPDAYSINAGLTKVNGRTDYPPIRALISGEGPK